ncbi:uncharacterized protein [Mytilus edulis]|uniref:uncharacterized protein n=1 Tax=Mytilus edulis TaxID=6550 RepID=UPI0039F09FFA
MDDHVKEKVKLVLEVLLNSSTQIKDDTCLNKLIDLLRTKLDHVKDVEDCSIQNFLKLIPERTTSTAVFVFGIHVASILGSQTKLNALYESHVINVLQTALSHDLVAAPAVGEAFYKVLKTLPLYMIQSLKDLMSVTVEIFQQKNSLFLTKSAVQFVIFYFSKHSEDLGEHLTEFLERIYCEICRKADNDQQDSSEFSSICFDIMKEVITLEHWRTWMLKRFPDLTEKLFKILMSSNGSIFDGCLQCLLVAAQRFEGQALREFGIQMMNSIDILIENDITMGQEACSRMVNFGIWSEHLGWLKTVVSLPLYLLVPLDEEPEKIRQTTQTIRKQLTSRPRAIKIFCGTLEKVATLKLEDQHIKDMVIICFEMTVEDNRPSQLSDIQGYIYGSSKIQQKCLQMFDKDVWLPYSGRILSAVIKTCENSTVDNVTYSKCLDVIHHFLPSILNQRNHSIDQLPKLVFALQKHLCGISWESREATLSFIQKVLGSYKDDTDVISWYKENKLDNSVWQCLSDSEGYVRSTAVDCLADIILHQELQDHLLKVLDIDFDTVTSRIENSCSTDTEAFVRRSAVDCITKLWGDNSVLSSNSRLSLLKLMSNVMTKDFDWEVKLKVLDFWNQYINKELFECDNPQVTLPSNTVENNSSSISSDSGLKKNGTKSKIKCLVASGCLGSLFSLTDDFDRSVIQKALNTTKNMKHFIEQNNLLTDMVFDKDSGEENCSNCKKQKFDLTLNQDISFEQGNKDEKDLLDWLLFVDIDQKLATFSQTCDEYDRNPISLLDDILLYAGSHVHDDEDDNTVIDCY